MFSCEGKVGEASQAIEEAETRISLSMGELAVLLADKDRQHEVRCDSIRQAMPGVHSCACICCWFREGRAAEGRGITTELLRT